MRGAGRHAHLVDDGRALRGEVPPDLEPGELQEAAVRPRGRREGERGEAMDERRAQVDAGQHHLD
eukprot:CAMPEP_0119361810 /NCGR_PEP_ID=MMETSP1334-20130426/9046_1 /TAXON_ID=127549 /ORGANISM="Calcidiscus leptoporus, Strain RCC1130" /LENGTH=64 /DNA_ID=CAMNT_0007376919 /DNA_START=39 /DNA_END=230 /DNA_ORIENTATION=+